MQNSSPFDAIIRRIGQDGIAKSNGNFLKLAMASLRAGRSNPRAALSQLRTNQKKPSFFGL